MTPTRTIATWAAVAAAWGCVTTAAAGYAIAAQAIAPPEPRRYPLHLAGTQPIGTETCLGLPATRQTRTPGIYSVYYPGGHAVVGRVVRRDRHLVWRKVERDGGGNLQAARHGSWSGHVHSTPDSLGLPWQALTIQTPAGPAPAWYFPKGDTPTRVMAIHLHGLGSTRAGVLRGVPSAHNAGIDSLVISYRNDGEGPWTDNHKSTLGIDEARDLEAAITHALNLGAEMVILVGWSMGATVALHASTDGPHREQIVGVIGISPVLDWRSTLHANCRKAGIPSFLGDIAMLILENTLLARSLNLPHPLSLGEWPWPGWVRGVNHPTLLISGRRDRFTVPALISDFEARAPSLCTAIGFDADHTMEWNRDPAKWSDTVTKWIQTVTQSA